MRRYIMKFMHLNNSSRPLIFLGTNYNMHQYREMCDTVGISIEGIIDSDYFGNTDTFCGIPIIDSEHAFSDSDTLEHYRKNFNFFCAVNWTPIDDPIQIRNRLKRIKILKLIDQYDLSCISLISKHSCISASSTIGRGVFIDNFVNIESNVEINDFVNIYAYTHVGHDSVIGKNGVFQRECMLSHESVFEENVYFAPLVKTSKGGVCYSAGTFIQEGIYVRRGTTPGEIVSLDSGNPRRVRQLESSKLNIGNNGEING